MATPPPPVSTIPPPGDIYGNASISPNLPLGADLCRRLSGILIIPELVNIIIWGKHIMAAAIAFGTICQHLEAAVLVELPQITFVTTFSTQIFGALVWIMIASTNVVYATQLTHGWILFVSVTLCFFSLLQFIIYLLSIPQQTYAWVALDAAYNCIAFISYFSAAVLEASVTSSLGQYVLVTISQQYQLNIAATVFIYIVTALYGASAFISLKRWKNRQP